MMVSSRFILYLILSSALLFLLLIINNKTCHPHPHTNDSLLRIRFFPPPLIPSVPNHRLQGGTSRRLLQANHLTRREVIQTPKPQEERLDEGMHTEVEYQLTSTDQSISDDELIYHIDYHGVTTHPNPSPKHPVQKKQPVSVRPLHSRALPSP